MIKRTLYVSLTPSLIFTGLAIADDEGFTIQQETTQEVVYWDY